ncbi:MAG: LPS export ABC transporter ATP-binding protein [Candidatus Poribacteria bacterium]|nr:LPS export ABC transporter ATP-binding protein [Candidatus Poribacteria bacterium]
MATLRPQNLVKSYGKRRVVNGVTLEVNTGEIVGLLGPNGAGKTQTFRMTVGLVTPNEGSVSLDGDDITSLPMYQRARKGIAYLPQEPSIFRKLTVGDNLMAVLETRPMTKQERVARKDELLDEFGLTRLEKNMAFTLSGGEQRRTEIARTLAIDPKFILLDEPFAGIDPKTIHDIQQVITQLRDRGIGVIITDHNAAETLQIADRAYLLVDGNILLHGSAEELTQDETARQLYFGDIVFSRRPKDSAQRGPNVSPTRTNGA